MKMSMMRSILILFSASLISCQISISKRNEELSPSNTTILSDTVPFNSLSEVPVDLCRCLTEPGNSEWMNSNQDACRSLISKEIGVENWEKVNFSQNPDLNRKWDELVEKCTGSKKVVTGNETIDKNNEIIPQIGTSYGYIWESINLEAQVYTTLAFDGLKFRTTVYTMNNETNSENFTKFFELSGSWVANGLYKAEGIIERNEVLVRWDFDADYQKLVNNKGVVFNKVRVK